MKRYKFTIITVCYNAEKYITNTIKSLLQQKFLDYEYIIKDGGSSDRTMEYIYMLTSSMKNVHIISEKDNGIYDAMNIAINMANGDYVYFLNAGDCFIDNAILEKTAKFIGKKNFDVVYGNVALINQSNYCIKKYGKIYSRKIFYLSGDCICHQAMFAKRALFERKQFDIKYKVCADKEWQLYFLSQNVEFVPMYFEIAEVLIDGFSKDHRSDFEKETCECLEKYCKPNQWIYQLILKLKKNKICLCIFRFAEGQIFHKN